MSKEEMILTLSNVMIMLDKVDTHGKSSVNALLFAMQNVEAVLNSMKKEGADENGDHA